MTDKEKVAILSEALATIRKVYSPRSVAYRQADEALSKTR